jgi:tetratricopeptide (TPR) repeat protein
MVVEYLVSEYGIDKLLQILTDLGVGMPINDALRRVTGSLAEFDAQFAEYLRAEAEGLAPELDWEKPPSDPSTPLADVLSWAEARDDNFYALQMQAARLMRDQRWEAAQAPLEKLIAAYPEYVEPDNAYELLARCHRQLGETREEQAVLKRLAERDDDCLSAYLRLAELAVEVRDWPAAAGYAKSALAVNPLLRSAHAVLAEASASLEHREEAIRSYNALLGFEATDVAETHFRLARLLRDSGDNDAAKRHLLDAIEAAPRYRAALDLLLELNDADTGDSSR